VDDPPGEIAPNLRQGLAVADIDEASRDRRLAEPPPFEPGSVERARRERAPVFALDLL
jgi:hypothetical protein